MPVYIILMLWEIFLVISSFPLSLKLTLTLFFQSVMYVKLHLFVEFSLLMSLYIMSHLFLLNIFHCNLYT